jgi:hypothetical protein
MPRVDVGSGCTLKSRSSAQGSRLAHSKMRLPAHTSPVQQQEASFRAAVATVGSRQSTGGSKNAVRTHQCGRLSTSRQCSRTVTAFLNTTRSPLVLLHLDVLPFYELIIKSPAAALQQCGHLPHAAIAALGRKASNAASGGRHSVAKLVMSDKQWRCRQVLLEVHAAPQ